MTIAKPNSLKEAELSKEAYKARPQIEPQIQDLVKSVEILGYRTIASCRGHCDGVRVPHPWLRTREYWPQLKETVSEYNSSAVVQWTLDDNTLQPTAHARTEEGLRMLQIEADKLAQFLFSRASDKDYETYVKERVVELW